MRRVAVTGIGVVTPLGNDIESFFGSLTRGRSGIARLTGPMATRRGDDLTVPARTHIGGAVAFDATQHFTAPKLRMLDRVSQFALVAAAQAVRAAGIRWDDVDRARSGVFSGPEWAGR